MLQQHFNLLKIRYLKYLFLMGTLFSTLVLQGKNRFRFANCMSNSEPITVRDTIQAGLTLVEGYFTAAAKVKAHTLQSYEKPAVKLFQCRATNAAEMADSIAKYQSWGKRFLDLNLKNPLHLFALYLSYRVARQIMTTATDYTLGVVCSKIYFPNLFNRTGSTTETP